MINSYRKHCTILHIGFDLEHFPAINLFSEVLSHTSAYAKSFTVKGDLSQACTISPMPSWWSVKTNFEMFDLWWKSRYWSSLLDQSNGGWALFYFSGFYKMSVEFFTKYIYSQFTLVVGFCLSLFFSFFFRRQYVDSQPIKFCFLW